MNTITLPMDQYRRDTELTDLWREHAAVVVASSAPATGPEVYHLTGPVGLAEEAGEVLGLFKKRIIHGHPHDRAKLVEELGDVMWYFQRLLITEGISLEEVVFNNTNKIKRRYPNGFSTAASIARVDTRAPKATTEEEPA